MAERQILVLNAGSSTLKLGLFAWDDEEQLIAKSVDWKSDASLGIGGHADALRYLLDGVDLAAVAAVGHRVVHGGATYVGSVQIDAAVKEAIGRLAEIAPLHNPPALAVIAAAEALLPGVPQVAAFDTAFHATMTPEEYIYPLPYEWYTDWGVRRYGFHGLSHAYCAGRAAEMLNWGAGEGRLVICHLGNGCSLSAVVGGRSVATTMGFTPVEGVMMGTRSGSVDPGLLAWLLENNRVSPAELDRVLNYQSGLLAISGVSSDVRTLLEARDKGNERATLALAMFCNRVRQAIGAMAAAAGGIDALVFTAGIGENARPLREAIATPLAWLGIDLDPAANETLKPDAAISRPNSKVRLLIIHTREDLVVARETKLVLGDGIN